MTQFAVFLQYGDFEFFRSMLALGFTDVEYRAGGKYVSGVRVLALLACYGPRERGVMPFEQIATWQTLLAKNSLVAEEYATVIPPHDEFYSVAAFDQFARRHRLSQGKRVRIEAVVEEWRMNPPEDAEHSIGGSAVK